MRVILTVREPTRHFSTSMLCLAKEIAAPDMSDCGEDDTMMRMMQVHRAPTAHQVVYIEIKGIDERQPWTLLLGFDRDLSRRRPVEAHFNGCNLFCHYHQVWDWSFWAIFVDQLFGIPGYFDTIAVDFSHIPSFHYRISTYSAWPFPDIGFCYPGLRNRELHARHQALIAELWSK